MDGCEGQGMAGCRATNWSMSDWPYLNRCRVRAPVPAGILPHYATEDSDGWNGMFRLPMDGATIRCVSSDGSGEPHPDFQWQHVSVSVEGDKRPPRWSVMCRVKDLFWEPEDWVVQFHPAQSEYVNFHPACLHLWRPLLAKMPTPLSIMVGPKSRR